MKKEWQDIISSYLGVEPIEINSSLVSAQNRRRLYWTNIPNVTQPQDKNIKLEDILEDIEFPNPAAIRGRRLNKATIVGRRLDKNGHRKDTDKTIPITQCLEVRATNTDKSNCLTTVDKDMFLRHFLLVDIQMLLKIICLLDITLQKKCVVYRLFLMIFLI